jgi:hypothetical protein
MKINELRKLIGKEVQWEEHYCPKAGYGIARRGVLVEVRGRNALIEQGGCNDWKWVPDMRCLAAAEESK